MVPMLSIIVPIYNSENYIKKCLNSILVCDENFELILVDDGSKDNSPSICDQYEKNFSKVKVFHTENHGVSYARNFGISKANGKYIMFVDSDDFLNESWYKVFKFIDDNSEIIYFTIEKVENNHEVILNSIIGTNEKINYLAGPVSKLFLRKFLIENGIFFKELLINGEDMLFNVNALVTSKKTRVVNMNIYNYRLTKGSATKRFNNNIIKSDKLFHVFLEDCMKKLVSENDLYYIQDFLGSNAILMIINRLSYISNYAEARKYMSFIKEEPYSGIIKNKNKYSFKKKLIFALLNIRLYFLVYYMFKIKNKINNVKNKNEFFVKI